MKILFKSKELVKSKEGGLNSIVTGYWLIESKKLFSICLLRFDRGSREAYHNHAFNAISWILSGRLNERIKYSKGYVDVCLTPSILPIFTSRERMHKVSGLDRKTWVLSFRGPWRDTWKEFFASTNKEITLTHGRKVLQ